MDIIITGKAGDEKARTAIELTHGITPRIGIAEPVTNRQEVVQQLHEARAKSILFFEEAVPDLAALNAALKAVKDYREQTGLAGTAVYCRDGETTNIIQKPI